jgi:hypothetical protein
MGLLRPLPNMETFTERDYEIVCSRTPPSPINRFVHMVGLRMGRGNPDNCLAVSYARAEAHAAEVLARPDVPEYVRKYLAKRGKRISPKISSD